MNDNTPQDNIVCLDEKLPWDAPDDSSRLARPANKRSVGPITFRDWRKVPQEQWKTAKQWKQVSRRVNKGETPKGRVIYTRIISGMQMLFTIPEKTLYEDDEHAEVIDKEIPLYHFLQTRPVKLRPRTEAILKYSGIFFQQARKNQYIARQIDPETEKEEWTTVTAYASGDTPWQRGELLEQHIVRHVNHKEWSAWINRKPFRRHTIGIKATDMTRFVAIDLDNHAKDDTAMFLQRAALLLDHFHGDGWHYQVQDGAVAGIHFIKVFEKPIPLEQAHHCVRTVLSDLDAKHPDLEFHKIEVYPTKGGNGFRLPLARGYLMILDNIIGPVVYRKQEAGDVEAYVAWVENPNREYFAKDRLISYLRMNANDVPKPKEAAVRGASVPSQLGKLRGCCWTKITRYWLGEFNPPNSFDAVISVTARIVYAYGHAQDLAAATIKQFARDLPQHAHHCSSRLAAGDWDEIDRCIAKQVNKVYKGNAGQPDVDKSDSLLQRAVARWSSSGLDILDKSTWIPVVQAHTAIILTEADRRLIEAGFGDLLGPEKYRHLACDVAIGMARMAEYQMCKPVTHVRQRAISYRYWQTFLQGYGIRAGNRNKVAQVIDAAEKLGIVAVWCGHSHALKRATIYEPGQRMQKYIKKTQETPDAPYNGSILFAYHFSDAPGSEAVNKEDHARLLLGDDAWDEAAAWAY